MIIPKIFYMFLCGSHAVGWALIAKRAKKERFLDLCQFVRAFLFAPIIYIGTLLITTGILLFIWKLFIPNILIFSITVFSLVGSMVIFFALGNYVLTPAVKKVYGVAKPFSEKICIVMYRANK